MTWRVLEHTDKKKKCNSDEREKEAVNLWKWMSSFILNARLFLHSARGENMQKAAITRSPYYLYLSLSRIVWKHFHGIPEFIIIATVAHLATRGRSWAKAEAGSWCLTCEIQIGLTKHSKLAVPILYFDGLLTDLAFSFYASPHILVTERNVIDTDVSIFVT